MDHFRRAVCGLLSVQEQRRRATAAAGHHRRQAVVLQPPVSSPGRRSQTPWRRWTRDTGCRPASPSYSPAAYKSTTLCTASMEATPSAEHLSWPVVMATPTHLPTATLTARWKGRQLLQQDAVSCSNSKSSWRTTIIISLIFDFRLASK